MQCAAKKREEAGLCERRDGVERKEECRGRKREECQGRNGWCEVGDVREVGMACKRRIHSLFCAPSLCYLRGESQRAPQFIFFAILVRFPLPLQ